MKLRLTFRAKIDIIEISDHIARQSPDSAERVLGVIRMECERVAAFPEIGAPTRYRGIRRVPMVRYRFTILYRVSRQDHSVEMLRVIAGARVKNLLTPPGRS